MIRALVTGASGFVGRYLVRHLCETGRLVYTASRNAVPDGENGTASYTVDVSDSTAVDAVFQAVLPDEVYHLAAIASPVGFDPTAYLRVNVEGTMHVLQAAMRHTPHAHVLVVTSGLAYGECAMGLANEDTLLRPLGAYASSKAAADLLAGAYRQSGLAVVRARPFNHTGPGQASGYLASAIARQVARIASGLQEPRLELGNLDSRRDFTDVRDIVEAYRMLIEDGAAGECYNICSGSAISVAELAELALKVRGIRAEIVSVPTRRRPEDIQVLVGSPAKVQDLGWSRRLVLEQSMAELVEYWEAAAR